MKLPLFSNAHGSCPFDWLLRKYRFLILTGSWWIDQQTCSYGNYSCYDCKGCCRVAWTFVMNIICIAKCCKLVLIYATDSNIHLGIVTNVVYTLIAISETKMSFWIKWRHWSGFIHTCLSASPYPWDLRAIPLWPRLTKTLTPYYSLNNIKEVTILILVW